MLTKCLFSSSWNGNRNKELIAYPHGSEPKGVGAGKDWNEFLLRSLGPRGKKKHTTKIKTS